MQLPGAIIFIDNVVDEISSILSLQLSITETISGQEFDLRISNDPNYKKIIHNFGLRILVIRTDYPANINRKYADIISTVNGGMISILKYPGDPDLSWTPGKTFPIDRINIFKLLQEKHEEFEEYEECEENYEDNEYCRHNRRYHNPCDNDNDE